MDFDVCGRYLSVGVGVTILVADYLPRMYNGEVRFIVWDSDLTMSCRWVGIIVHMISIAIRKKKSIVRTTTLSIASERLSKKSELHSKKKWITN